MHDLDTTYGLSNSMIYANETPWHRHGTHIPEGLSVADAIAACPAVDFNTVTVPVHYLTDAPHTAANFRAIIRDDTSACLGMATDRYSPIQIREQWAGLDPLIDAGIATIETLGSLAGGKRVWGMVRINKEHIPWWSKMEESLGEINPYSLALDDKTGKRQAMFAPVNTRVVCHNTLEAAKSGLTHSVTVRHTGDTASKIKEAANELWGDMVATYERLAQRYYALKQRTLTGEEFDSAVLDAVAKLPTDPNQYASPARFEGARDRAQAKRLSVLSMWSNGAGHTGDRSAWEALNGAVEALDHNAAGAFYKSKDPIGSLVDGPIAAMKNQITQNLVALSIGDTVN